MLCVWVPNFCTEFMRREATCVSKSNVFGGFSKHMWLFVEGFMEEPVRIFVITGFRRPYPVSR